MLSAGRRYEKAPQYCSRECKRKERKRLRSLEDSPEEQSTSYALPIVTSPTVKIKPIIDPAAAAAAVVAPVAAKSDKHPTEWTVGFFDYFDDFSDSIDTVRNTCASIITQTRIYISRTPEIYLVRAEQSDTQLFSLLIFAFPN